MSYYFVFLSFSHVSPSYSLSVFSCIFYSFHSSCFYLFYLFFLHFFFRFFLASLLSRAFQATWPPCKAYRYFDKAEQASLFLTLSLDSPAYKQVLALKAH